MTDTLIDGLSSANQILSTEQPEPVWTVLDDGSSERETITLLSTSGIQHQPQEPTDKKEKKSIPTDSELARRWQAEHPLTAWGMGAYRRYYDGIWQIVPTDTIKSEIKLVLEAAKIHGIRSNIRLLNSVLEMGRLDIAISTEKWDADPNVLVCKNGTLHIPTGTLHSHDPKYYATSALQFDYDPTATAPVFNLVLDTCIPEAKGFLQQFAGYALTVDTSYEIAVWFQGPPGGGKSTILEGLLAMLGTRAGLLGLADIERSRFALTELPGKTLVVSTEQPATYMSVTHTLNALISGERITVDRKFVDPVTLIPHAKIIWAMNELPRVSEASNGLFRRVKVIRFQKISEDQRDPKIKESVKLEGAGILNWALEGLAKLRENGRFIIPACVQEATRDFRETNDIPALFVDECCILDPDKKTQGQVLYDAYKEWCIKNGHKPQSSTSIAENWRRLGFEKHKAAGKVFWHGIGILPTSKPHFVDSVDT